MSLTTTHLRAEIEALKVENERLKGALVSCQHARDGNSKHIEWLKEQHRFQEIHRFHLARFCEEIRSRPEVGSERMGNRACAILDHVDASSAAITCEWQREGVERHYNALIASLTSYEKALSSTESGRGKA